MRKTFLLLALVGCGNDTPTPTEVRTAITGDLGFVLREASAAAEAGDVMPSGAAFDTLARMVGGGAGTSFLPRVSSKLAGIVAPRSDERARGKRGLALPLQDGAEAFDSDEITNKLNTELFTDANHLGNGLYRVPAELVCMDETFEDDGSITEALDAECARDLDAAQLRIAVRYDDNDAMVFGLQVGAAADEPFRFVLGGTSLALIADLDQASRAVVALAPVLGEEIPNVSLKGQVTGKVEILAPASARFSIGIERAIAIAGADAGVDLAGPDAFRFTSATGNVLSLELDGNTRAGALMFALGATTAHVPGEQAYDLDLPGMTAVAMMLPNQPVQLAHVGLGERSTTVSVDGQRAITIDLNPDDGRAFGAKISRGPGTDGIETFEVSPKLDLRFAIDHSVLGGERPVYDVTRLLLEGSIRADGERAEVVSGQLSMATDPTQYGFTATAGQCATATEVEDVTTGQFYEQWSAGTCN